MYPLQTIALRWRQVFLKCIAECNEIICMQPESGIFNSKNHVQYDPVGPNI